MTLDYTISIGNILTAFTLFMAAFRMFYSLHKQLDKRITQVERALAILEQATTDRHIENNRRFDRLERLVIDKRHRANSD